MFLDIEYLSVQWEKTGSEMKGENHFLKKCLFLKKKDFGVTCKQPSLNKNSQRPPVYIYTWRKVREQGQRAECSGKKCGLKREKEQKLKQKMSWE